jgi:hypothetical protein
MKPQGNKKKQAPCGDGHADSHNGNNGEMRMKCEEIQAVLFDYMTRELGGARSDLVHEHLRKCPECQKAAGEIEATLALLGQTSAEETGISTSLSDRRRERIVRAIKHPLLDWIYVHHIIASVVVAVVVILVSFTVLYKTRLWRDPPTPGPTIIIGDPNGKPEQREPGPEIPVFTRPAPGAGEVRAATNGEGSVSEEK